MENSVIVHHHRHPGRSPMTKLIRGLKLNFKYPIQGGSVCFMISILLVDDEPALLDLTRHFLERKPDMAVTTCSSAFEALKTQKIEKFNVVISDYEMAAMNGIDFLKELRSRGY